MSDEPPTVSLKIGMSAEGPMPIVVIADESVSAPVGVAYRDMREPQNGEPNPMPLKGFSVPLETDDEGIYVFGEEHSSPPLAGPTPALHKHFISDQSIATGLRPVVGNMFFGERVEIRVPPGAAITARNFDAPLFISGEMSDVHIEHGDFVCLDLASSGPTRFEIEVSNIRCVYGVVPTCGSTQFFEVEELRVRVERAASELFTDGTIELGGFPPLAYASANYSKYVELECGAGVSVTVGAVTAAHVKLEEQSYCLVAGAAEVLRIGDGPTANYLPEVAPALSSDDDAFVDLNGHFGTVINLFGPSMGMVGTVDELHVRSHGRWFCFDDVQVRDAAEIEYLSRQRPGPAQNTTLHAAPGAHPSIATTSEDLRTVGDWTHGPRAGQSASRVRRRAALEQAEKDLWAQAPSAQYEAARIADGERQQREATETPSRTRNPSIRAEGFGADLHGHRSSWRGKRDIDPLIAPESLGLQPPDIGFDY